MASITGELAAAVEQFGRPDVKTFEQRADQERSRIVTSFPVAEWPNLPLDRYALGLGADTVPYCQLLEYRTPNLGSIKGGSARKHIIYRRNDGNWWMAGPLEGLSPDEAWARVRAEFVAAIDAARSGRVEDIDALPLLKWGQALVTKTLAVYSPEHFLDVYSGDHLRQFITLFGGTPSPEATSWALNRQLLQLVRDTPQFTDWEAGHVLDFLYRHLDPRTGEAPILKIAPGERARLWEECLAGGVIRVGYGDVGDLRAFPDDDALVAALEEAEPHLGPTPLRKLAGQLFRFRDLPPSSRIVANRGTSEVLAVGTVTDVGYQYDPTLPE